MTSNPNYGVHSKTAKHIKAFSNSFLRSLASNLTYEHKHLQYFLLHLIDETNDDFVYSVNPNDWDINQIRQRSNLNAKRIRFLYRVRRFVEIYDEYYLDKYGKKPQNIFEYHKMLNIIDTQMLLGQRPNHWWTRDHDIDLIVGTFKYGYADYQSMKNDKDFGFTTLEKVCQYREFPSADALTRRLKKLVALIVRHEKTYKQFDFDSIENIGDIMREFSQEEALKLFTYVSNNGVPLTNDLKPNWNDLRDTFYRNNPNFESKVVSLVERLVQQFRMHILKMLHSKLASEDQKNIILAQDYIQSDINITIEQAETFFKQTNQINFIRKTILGKKMFKNNKETLESYIAQLQNTENHIVKFETETDYVTYRDDQ